MFNYVFVWHNNHNVVKDYCVTQIWNLVKLCNFMKNILKVRVAKESRSIRQCKTKLNSVAVVHKRTKPTERPPLVGEVSANFYG
jgi:hypothetical protein